MRECVCDNACVSGCVRGVNAMRRALQLHAGFEAGKVGKQAGRLGARSSEFGARSSEFGVRSSEFGARSSEFGARSSEFGAPSSAGMHAVFLPGAQARLAGVSRLVLSLLPPVGPSLKLLLHEVSTKE
ncbi:uncharacterized protein LOC144025552 [Festucalex cinctus]